MKIEQVKELSSLDRFIYWIRERDQILKKRRAGMSKPWTDDQILQTQYFTNVMRENDKVTIWFRENIREPLKDDPIVVFATIAFRWFNWPATGEQLLKYPTKTSHGAFTDWNLDAVKSRLHGIKEHGGQVFTGAFNISNSGSTKPKVNRVCEDYIQPVWKDLGAILAKFRLGTTACTLANAFKVLKEYPGLGGSGFMAAQVICDLAYTHVLRDAPDWMSWCSWGPGSKRGMNRVLGNSVDCPISQQRWKQHLDNLQIVIERRLGMKLHARDVQNCLCEFSKMENALWGDGHVKRRYAGT